MTRLAIYLQDAHPIGEAIEYARYAEAAGFEAVWQARAAYLAKGPTEAYGRIKTAIRGAFQNDLASQLALESRLQGECGKTRELTCRLVDHIERMEGVRPFHVQTMVHIRFEAGASGHYGHPLPHGFSHRSRQHDLFMVRRERIQANNVIFRGRLRKVHDLDH